MKKIKFLLIAMMAMMVTVSFTSCSDDDDDNNEQTQQQNIARYQSEVDAVVLGQKKSNKAILLVAFGSTWQKAFNTFDATLAAYKAKYPDYDVYMSFSSVICINNAASGVHGYENTETRQYYAPEYWLEAFGRVQYQDIVVQSLQVIPGEEYSRVINAIKDFSNNKYNDIDPEYLASANVYLGTPLMATEDDVENLAYALNENLRDEVAAGKIIAFMGHGNPNEYDTYSANVRYEQLEDALHMYSRTNYWVGTVDMENNFVEDVHGRMTTAGVTSGTVHCYPLMSIAGDHAHNDMVEDWGGYFEENHYTCEQTLEGLLDYPNIRQLWMNHTQDAIDGEPLEYNK